MLRKKLNQKPKENNLLIDNYFVRQNVNVILVKPDGSVLCQHRDNIPTILGPDTWCAPGGKKEETDLSLKSAAARELLEETGYITKENEMLLVVEEDYISEKGEPIHRTIYCAPYDEKQQINCYEGQEFRFIKLSELSKLKLYPGHDKFLKLASDIILSK